jgi:integrase/recombinase XerC
VPLSARKGKVIVRSGKGGDSREIPLLDPAARTALTEWKAERPAPFLNRRGGRLSVRAVDQLLDDLAADADLTDEDDNPAASAHTLRHTFGTNLLRNGADWVSPRNVDTSP